MCTAAPARQARDADVRPARLHPGANPRLDQTGHQGGRVSYLE